MEKIAKRRQISHNFPHECSSPEAATMSVPMLATTTTTTTIINFLAHQHKAAGVKIRLSKSTDHDEVSHGVECCQKGDRIPPLKSNR